MKKINKLSVQNEYAKKSICYGCGPANKKGLKIESYRSEEGLDLWFDPEPEHQAFRGYKRRNYWMHI